MRKEEAVTLMTKAINDMNAEKAEEHGVPAAEVQQMIWQDTPELNRVNGMLFDVLYENGYINYWNKSLNLRSSIKIRAGYRLSTLLYRDRQKILAKSFISHTSL
jgi:hypothetical protein